MTAGAATMSDVSTFRGDSGRAGVMPGPLPEQAPEKLWSLDAFPTDPSMIADGVVYVPAGDALFGGDPGVLYAIDALTGDERWRYESGSDIWAAPAIANDTAYAGSADGTFTALAAADGTERWQATVGPIVLAPAVVDDVVDAFGSSVPWAFRAQDGAEVRRYDTLDKEKAKPAQASAFAVYGGVVCLVTPGGDLLAVDATTGAKRWSMDGGNVALDAVTGTVRWREISMGTHFRTPHIDAILFTGGVVYYRQAGNLFALDASTGSWLWSFPVGSA